MVFPPQSKRLLGLQLLADRIYETLCLKTICLKTLLDLGHNFWSKLWNFWTLSIMVVKVMLKWRLKWQGLKLSSPFRRYNDLFSQHLLQPKGYIADFGSVIFISVWNIILVPAISEMRKEEEKWENIWKVKGKWSVHFNSTKVEFQIVQLLCIAEVVLLKLWGLLGQHARAEEQYIHRYSTKGKVQNCRSVWIFSQKTEHTSFHKSYLSLFST